MNKALYFGIGAILGAAGGSVATYFVTKEMFAQQAAEEIEAYAEHCEDRIEQMRLKYSGAEVEEEEETEKHSNDPEEEAINRNAGVKKYHHQLESISSYGSNNIFTTPQSEKEKHAVSKQISEITEREFMEQELEGYEKQTFDIWLGDDEDIVALWGYGTDNETDVEDRFGKSLAYIIGEENATYDALLSMCNDEDRTGVLYFRNEAMKMDIEVAIHDSREDDYPATNISK